MKHIKKFNEALEDDIVDNILDMTIDLDDEGFVIGTNDNYSKHDHRHNISCDIIWHHQNGKLHTQLTDNMIDIVLRVIEYVEGNGYVLGVENPQRSPFRDDGKLSYRIFENGTTLKYKFITPDQLDEYKGTWFNEIGLVFRLV